MRRIERLIVRRFCFATNDESMVENELSVSKRGGDRREYNESVGWISSGAGNVVKQQKRSNPRNSILKRTAWFNKIASFSPCSEYRLKKLFGRTEGSLVGATKVLYWYTPRSLFSFFFNYFFGSENQAIGQPHKKKKKRGVSLSLSTKYLKTPTKLFPPRSG